MFRPMRVTFHLDGAGVYYDPAEPLTLDGLLAWCCARHHIHGEPPARDEAPADIPLPLQKWEQRDAWGWHASALFPEGATAETITRWRKRFRQHRVERTTGSPNLTNGTYRDWDMPVPLLLTRTMVAYAYGEIREVKRELRRNVRYLGKKRAHGHGAVIDISVDPIECDYSISKDGIAMRWMPDDAGFRLVRPRPPYWSSIGRVRCAEIGTRIDVASNAPSAR